MKENKLSANEELLENTWLSALKKSITFFFINIQKLTARIVRTMSAESDWVIVKIVSRGAPVIPRRETWEHSFLHKLHLITISAKSRLGRSARGGGELAYTRSRLHAITKDFLFLDILRYL